MIEQVDHPEHYKRNGKECYKCMVEEFGVKAVVDFFICSAYKYRWRAGFKEGNSKEQDLAKANKCLLLAEELLASME